MTKAPLIFDLGFHNGDDTDYYLAKGWQVIAVDANASLISDGQNRFATALNNNQLTLLHHALAKTGGETDFYIHPTKTDWSSCLKDMTESDGSEAITAKVKGITLHDLVGAHGVPDYLKVDVEGMDAVVAEQLSRLEKKPPYVSFEIAKANYYSIFAYLYVSGYRSFQLVNQANNPTRTAMIESNDGKAKEHHFSALSSGPIGDDLPARGWHSYDEILTRYVKFKELKYMDNQELALGWIDLHARLEVA